MTKKKPERQPQAHREPVHHGPEEAAMAALKVFREKYAWHTLSILLGVLILLFVVKGYQNRRAADRRSSWSHLEALGSVYPGMPAKKAEEERDRIVTGCQNILNDHWKTSATPWVMLKMARTQLGAGKPADAAKSFKKLIDEYGDRLPARLAWRLYGCALEEDAKYKGAAQWFEKVAPRLTGDMKARVLWDAGRNYESAHDRGAAQKAYNEVVKLDPKSELGRLAEYRLEALKLGETAPSEAAPAEKPTAQERGGKVEKKAPSAEKKTPVVAAPVEKAGNEKKTVEVN